MIKYYYAEKTKFFEDETEIKKLIKAVYGLAVSLEFMDDPDVFVSANNTLGLKNIKDFIELLLAKTSE